MARLIFILISISSSLVFCKPLDTSKRFLLAEEMAKYNLEFGKKSDSIAKLKKNSPELLSRIRTQLKLTLENEKIYGDELGALSLALHNLSMASVFADDKFKAETKMAWLNFVKVITKSKIAFKGPFKVSLLRLKIKDVLSVFEFANFIRNYRDAIPKEAWKFNYDTFLLRPCELFEEVGMVSESISCYEQTQSYFLTYDPGNQESISNIEKSQFVILADIKDESKFLALTRNKAFTRSDSQKQSYLIQYDIFTKDLVSMEKRLTYLKNFVPNRPPAFARYVDLKRLQLQYLKSNQKEDLAKFNNYLESNRAEQGETILRNDKRFLLEAYANGNDWKEVEKISKSYHNFEDLKLLEINSFYCLSTFVAVNSISMDCINYWKAMDKKLVATDKLHWRYRRYRYLYMILNKTLKLKDRKEITNYLSKPEVAKVTAEDPFLKFIASKYLKF